MATDKDHEKLKRLADIRKLREQKANRAYQEAFQDMTDFQETMQKQKEEVSQFLNDRNTQIRILQNKIRTEPVNGQLIQKYLHLQEDTQLQTSVKYQELEKKSQKYYELLDKVNETYLEFEGHSKARVKFEKMAEQKFEVYKAEQDLKEEELVMEQFTGAPSGNGFAND